MYFQYFEQVRALSGLVAEAGDTKTSIILARSECKYRRPVTFPDTLIVGFSSEAINTERGDFRHHYIVYSTKQKQVVSTGEADLVCYNYKTKRRQPVPSDWVFRA